MNSWRKKGLLGVSSFLAFLIIVTLSGCSPASVNDDSTQFFSLRVHPYANGDLIGCDYALTLSDSSWAIDKLAFFISSVEIKSRSTGHWRAIELKTNQWQSNGTGLLWFNTRCDRQTPQNKELALVISHEDWRKASAVRFELGVPFSVNHLNPVTQESPLNVPDMFWTWQAGHKFFRLDLMSQNKGENKAWSYHLGSLGCKSASSLRAPSQPCKTPNRFSVEVSLDTSLNEFVFDMDSLLSGVQLNSQTSCMFHSAQESSCDQLSQNWLSRPIFRQSQGQLPSD
ncbi:MbnP family copper-binding protein [Alteromonas sp. KUL49]|uniref:MbnP family copper-binding protein n=1 Tax=Alteromonas sp. KUL49 TaxID=2480798 RepID=UPI00102F0467|nr:MbnP family copper-binding protein [Alteromonas sp. KUL49]TAP35467.1 metallo-mystery pair system four-Cys motif protein [Alteromonas sp. KUL49]